MKHTVIELEWHLIDPPTLGGWCPQCHLPAVAAFRCALAQTLTLNVIRTVTFHHCTDCHTTRQEVH